MSWEGKTIGEAREILSKFLLETGAYSICAKCPVYPGGVGCCHGCSHLVHGKEDGTACRNRNISCLSYACNTLATYLSLQSSKTHPNKLIEFLELTYGLPREGYRGCDRRPESELLEIEDPLELRAHVSLGDGRKGKETRES